jgi:hypothetical protein
LALTRRLLLAASVSLAIAAAPAGATAAVALNGSFFTTVLKPTFTGTTCPSGLPSNVAECGVIQLAGLGPADFVYLFGPAFEPSGRCFDVDGTFTLTLQSDGSAIAGPLTGVFCPSLSGTGHQHSFGANYGNPASETDSISFSGGTGQFDGLAGLATFSTQSAGANFRGTLTGTLQ